MRRDRDDRPAILLWLYTMAHKHTLDIVAEKIIAHIDALMAVDKGEMCVCEKPAYLRNETRVVCTGCWFCTSLEKFNQTEKKTVVLPRTRGRGEVRSDYQLDCMHSNPSADRSKPVRCNDCGIVLSDENGSSQTVISDIGSHTHEHAPQVTQTPTSARPEQTHTQDTQ